MTREPFFKRITSQLPVLFPLVGLFHLYLLVRAFIDFRNELGNFEIILTLAGIILYCIFWIATCDLHRWAGIGYILLTAACLCLQYFLPAGNPWNGAGNYFFPFNALFTFFIVFYYKRLR